MTRQSPIIKTTTLNKGLTPSQAINHFYQAIIDKDVEKIIHFYVPDEKTYVILEGPRYATLGFNKIRKGWRDFCDCALTIHSIEWVEEGSPFGESNGDMAWLAGVIHLAGTVRGKPLLRKFRASFVLRKHEESWRIQHEHISAPMNDPYDMGDWLKK
ncbi:MAG: hypothetical protein RL329_3751 [Bacteroidota bacterium]|jgi:ketosteroid isomerase-like protein